MKRLGNKGMAIELVIITAVVVFALCTIMTLYSVNALNYNDFAKNRINTKLFIDNIGERYSMQINGGFYIDTSEEISCNIGNSETIYICQENTLSDETKVFKLIEKKSKSVALIIEYKKDVNGKYQISRWSYGE